MTNYDRSEKLRNIFTKDSDRRLDPRFLFVAQCIGGGCLAGFFIGGRTGAHVSAVEHVESSQLMIFDSKTHAQRLYQSRIAVGFVKNGLRFGWRAGLIAGLYSGFLVTFQDLQGDQKSTHFLYSGALTGVVYKCLAGWRSMVAGAIIGSGLSLPAALFTGAVNQFASDEIKESLKILNITSSQYSDIVKETEETEPNTRVDQWSEVMKRMEKDLEDDIAEKR